MSNHRPRRAARVVAATALCVSGILSGGAQPISADDVGNASSSVSQAQNQLNNDQGKSAHLGNVITTLTGQIAALQTEVEQVKAAIATLDTQIAAQEKVVADAQARLAQIARDLDAATVALEQARQHLALDQTNLAAQMVKMYEQPPSSTVNAVFGASTFDELWQQVIAAKRVGDAAQSQVDRVKQEKAKRDQIVAQITDEKAQQAQVLAHQQAAETALQQDRANRASLEQQLQQAEAADEAQKAAAEQARQQVQQELVADAANLAAAKDALARAEAAGAGTGHFIWPLQGGITQYWGCTSWPYERYVPSCPYPHAFHDGIDIGAAWGTSIDAADAGVAHVYWSCCGYGLHVIISHGNGWLTIYGHMSGFAIRDGQFVGRGQLIGYEGSTGNSSGPHLHFEIDVNCPDNCHSVNPLNYLP